MSIASHCNGECGVRPCRCHPDKPEGLVEDLMTALSPVIAGNTIDSSQEESLSREIERTIREELSKRVGTPIEEIEHIVKPIIDDHMLEQAQAALLWLKIENALITSTLWPVMSPPADEVLAK